MKEHRYLKSTLLALALATQTTHAAQPVTVTNTAANPVQVKGQVTVGNTVPITVTNAVVPVTGQVTVGNTVPITITNPSVPVTGTVAIDPTTAVAVKGPNYSSVVLHIEDNGVLPGRLTYGETFYSRVGKVSIDSLAATCSYTTLSLSLVFADQGWPALGVPIVGGGTVADGVGDGYGYAGFTAPQPMVWNLPSVAPGGTTTLPYMQVGLPVYSSFTLVANADPNPAYVHFRSYCDVSVNFHSLN